MKVTTERGAGPSIDVTSAPSGRTAKTRVPTETVQATSVDKGSNLTSASTVEPVQPSTDVTFRRDQTGRVFYVLTDAKSGKELRQIPPEVVRSVGEGIDEYLKKEEQAAKSPHVEVKA